MIRNCMNCGKKNNKHNTQTCSIKCMGELLKKQNPDKTYVHTDRGWEGTEK